MFEKTLGARVGARASALRMDFRLPANREMAHIVLAVLSLCAAVILFFAWLTLSDSRHLGISGSGPESDCASLGRGGVYCTGHPTSGGQSNAGFGHEGDCANLGKGGRVCAERPMTEDHSN